MAHPALGCTVSEAAARAGVSLPKWLKSVEGTGARNLTCKDSRDLIHVTSHVLGSLELAVQPRRTATCLAAWRPELAAQPVQECRMTGTVKIWQCNWGKGPLTDVDVGVACVGCDPDAFVFSALGMSIPARLRCCRWVVRSSGAHAGHWLHML